MNVYLRAGIQQKLGGHDTVLFDGFHKRGHPNPVPLIRVAAGRQQQTENSLIPGRRRG